MNPYEPPKALDQHQAPPNMDRALALRAVRVATLIFLIPALYNFFCFSVSTTANQIQSSTNLFRAINSIGLIAIVLAIWFFGLAALELTTGCIYSLWGKKSDLVDWKSDLYSTLQRAPAFAILGAVLWSIWVAGFYQFGIGFYIISIPIGILSHLLAASLYTPLVYRWYNLERSAASSGTN